MRLQTENEKETAAPIGVEALREESAGKGRMPIGVLLYIKPRLLREMTRQALSRIPGIRIVGDCIDQEGIRAVIDRDAVHWVMILTVDEQSTLQEDTGTLFNHNPALSLLEITLDGGSLIARWFDLHEKTIRNPTLEDIVSVLHSGYHRKTSLR